MPYAPAVAFAHHFIPSQEVLATDLIACSASEIQVLPPFDARKAGRVRIAYGSLPNLNAL